MSESSRFEITELLRARILVVEDNAVNAMALENSLKNLGYSLCGITGSGEEAIALALDRRPDLLLMDIWLSGAVDGIEAARSIRERLDVPLVFMTAGTDPDTMMRAAEVGPDAYVVKPYDEQELQATLIMAMCRHRAYSDLDRRVKERTRALARSESRYRRLESITNLGLFALGTLDTEVVIESAVSLVARTLEVDLVKVLELQPDGKTLVLRAGVGWRDGLLGTAVEEVERDSQPATLFDTAEAIVIPDLRRETRFKPASFLVEHGVVSGASVAIFAPGPEGQPYGSLGAHSRARRDFSDSDLSFLQAVGNVIATAIVRTEAEEKLLEAERMAREEAVRASLAEQAVRARDEFLSVASHELRTPVAALQLQVEMLEELIGTTEVGLDPLVPAIASRAAGTVGRLAGLIEGILDVSRLAVGSLELERERFDLSELVHEVAERYQARARQAGCKLEVHESGPVSGDWDRERIEQAIANLLSNAFKFGAGKPVELVLETDGPEARIAIQDHGEGINPRDVERILRRFERAASHRHYGGLGLGLYIAGQIVKAHGGNLEVASEPGLGSTFTIVLPCAERPAAS